MKKNLLICFGKNLKNTKEFNLLEEHIKDTFEILYLTKQESSPEKIYLKINTIKNNSEYENYIFLSNILELTLIIYRLYHHTFNNFIYITGSKINNKKTYAKHLPFLREPLQEDEKCFKPLYIMEENQNNFPFPITTKQLDTKQLVTNSYIESQTNIYLYKNNFFLFDIQNTTYKIINLSDTQNHQVTFKKLTYDASIVSDQNMLATIYDVLIDTKKNLVEKFEALHNEFKSIEEKMQKNSLFKKSYSILFQVILNEVPIHSKIFLLSFLFSSQNNKSDILKEIILLTNKSSELTFEEKYFLLYQCVRINFTSNQPNGFEISEAIRELYSNIYNLLQSHLISENLFIPKEQRNQNLIFFFTGQFLSLNHAPTKTALDRCYHLIKTLEKEVILINTREVLTKNGFIPFYNCIGGNVIDNYNTTNSINYKDITLPYYQPQQAMPNLSDILNILQIVQEYKPYMILNIGSYNLTADLCSNLVPSASIATVFSSIPTSMSQFLVTGQVPNNTQLEIQSKYGIQKEQIIHSQFTFDLKEQTHQFTKKELNLPENKFLGVIIGARLDDEIDDVFIQMLLKSIDIGLHVVFIGKFSSYEQYCSSFETLKINSTNLGFQDDVLAITELCDIYLNPKRSGGGSSVLEALVKGKPAITLKQGDVYVNATDEFAVDSYEEMTNQLKRYMTDKHFYEEKSKKALLRSSELMDTAEQLKKLIAAIENNSFFK